MWFDARAKLAEIEGAPPATPATIATNAPLARPVSQLSQVSQPPGTGKPAPRVAEVASVATPPRPKPDHAPPARTDDPDAATFRHGQAPNGWPVTWTGRIVSLADWRDLTEWDRHGPDGRHWSGITRQWEHPD